MNPYAFNRASEARYDRDYQKETAGQTFSKAVMKDAHPFLAAGTPQTDGMDVLWQHPQDLGANASFGDQPVNRPLNQTIDNTSTQPMSLEDMDRAFQLQLALHRAGAAQQNAQQTYAA